MKLVKGVNELSVEYRPDLIAPPPKRRDLLVGFYAGLETILNFMKKRYVQKTNL